MGYRYIGSKNKILNIIVEEICQIAPKNGIVADLMCGTSLVSSMLRMRGLSVIANDLLTFCYHHAVVNLCFTEEPTFKKLIPIVTQASPQAQGSLFEETPYEKIVAALNAVEPVNGYFWREFSIEGQPANGALHRNYFSPSNAKKIDALRSAIKNMRQKGLITAREEILLRHDLVMAVNDVANIAGTYGHYMSRLLGRAKDPIVMKPTKLILLDDHGRHKAMCGYAEQAAKKISCSVCYIDPPYIEKAICCKLSHS